jgi:hypothetical protein
MIREILISHSNQLVLNLPDEFLNRKLEVLIFPISKEDNEIPEKTSLDKFIDFVNKRDKINPVISGHIDFDNIANEVNNDIF